MTIGSVGFLYEKSKRVRVRAYCLASVQDAASVRYRLELVSIRLDSWLETETKIGLVQVPQGFGWLQYLLYSIRPDRSFACDRHTARRHAFPSKALGRGSNTDTSRADGTDGRGARGQGELPYVAYLVPNQIRRVFTRSTVTEANRELSLVWGKH